MNNEPAVILALLGFLVLLVLLDMALPTRRNKLKREAAEILANAKHFKYLYQYDLALLKLRACTAMLENEELEHEIWFLRRHRDRLRQSGCSYAPAKDIEKAKKLLQLEDDPTSIKAINIAANKALEAYNLTALKRRKAPKGVLVEAQKRAERIRDARFLLIGAACH